MHTKNVAHRDLKPQNVMLINEDKDSWEVRVADFGFSTFFDAA